LGLLVKVLDQFLYMGQKLKPTSVDPLGLIFQNYLNISKPKFQKPLMNITSKFFSFNVWESFLLSSVLERTESHLSKINWLRGVILLHSNSVGALGQVFIVSHSNQNYFGFPGLDLNLDWGLCNHEVHINHPNIEIYLWNLLVKFQLDTTV